MSVEFTITDLQRDTGETARTLQYWSDLGLLQPLKATNKRGRGVQRIFPADPPFHGERVWALIASEMNKWRLPIGEIKEIIDRMRSVWSFYPDVAEKMRGPIGHALQGRLVAVVIGQGEQVPIAEVKFEQASDPEISFITWEAGLLGPTHKEDWKQYEGRQALLPGQFLAEHSSGYILNLTRVLRPLIKGSANAGEHHPPREE